MGRYLAAGIAVKVRAYKEKDLWNFDMSKMGEYKEKLKNQVGKFLDLSHFNIVEYEDSLEFNMDIDYFNNNIHDEYIKFKNVLNLSSDSYKLDNIDESKPFNKNEYPLELSYDEKMKYSFCINNEDDEVDMQPFASNVWLFYDSDKKLYDYDLFEVFEIHIDYACIYRDIEKISIEDDRNMLTALNLLCNHIFKDGLAKDISFYISG